MINEIIKKITNHFKIFTKNTYIKTPTTSFPSDDFWTVVQNRQDEEREKFEKWRKNLISMNTKNTYTTNTLIYNNITSGSISSTSLGDTKIRIDGGENGTMQVDVPLEVNGRDVMKEIDEMREAMLLLTRDLKLEELYPELKEAYDDYMELYRGIKIADKIAKTGDT